MQGVHLRKYGAAATIDFELYEIDGVDFRTDATFAAGDVKMMRDEAAEAQITGAAGGADLSTLVTDEGNGYSITLALEDMTAARIVLYFIDQTATKVWLDKSIVIETYGHASAQHALDLSVANGSNFTAIPAPTDMALDSTVAKDATVSKPGTAQTITPPADMALDSTVAKDATVAKAAACTEARLAELDAANIPTDIAAIPTNPLLATTTGSGLSAIPDMAKDSVCTATRLAELDAANLPTDIAAIPTTPMRGTDSAALAATLGTPSPISGGLATIASNLLKLADNAGGTAYQAATNSQKAIADNLTAVKADTNNIRTVDVPAIIAAIAAIPASTWTAALDGTYTATEIMQIIAAVLAGISTIDELGTGRATVTFRDLPDTKNRVVSTMDKSERTAVVITP